MIEKNKDRYKTRRLTKKAVKEGKLKIPKICSVCNKSERKVGMIVAHHNNYDDHMDITWVCFKCHGILESNKRWANYTLSLINELKIMAESNEQFHYIVETAKRKDGTTNNILLRQALNELIKRKNEKNTK